MNELLDVELIESCTYKLKDLVGKRVDIVKSVGPEGTLVCAVDVKEETTYVLSWEPCSPNWTPSSKAEQAL